MSLCGYFEMIEDAWPPNEQQLHSGQQSESSRQRHANRCAEQETRNRWYILPPTLKIVWPTKKCVASEERKRKKRFIQNILKK